MTFIREDATQVITTTVVHIPLELDDVLVGQVLDADDVRIEVGTRYGNVSLSARSLIRNIERQCRRLEREADVDRLEVR